MNPLDLVKISQNYPNSLWIQGGATGFDTQGEQVAEALGIPCKCIPAEWATYGKAAGPIRNEKMLDLAQLVVACWNGRTKGGTYQTITSAKRRGLEIVYLTPL